MMKLHKSCGPHSVGRLPQLNRSRARNRNLQVCAAIRARWCLDIRYGSKMDAIALLQDWVANIGSESGLIDATNCFINSGSVGVPESRLELEVEFDTLADLEQFWATIPSKPHKAWSERLQHVVVHGSPTWEIYRTVDAFPENPVITPQISTSSKPAAGSKPPSLTLASTTDINKYGNNGEPSLPSPTSTTESGLAVVSGEEDTNMVLDWKGDPMKINPKDKLPFKFL